MYLVKNKIISPANRVVKETNRTTKVLFWVLGFSMGFSSAHAAQAENAPVSTPAPFSPIAKTTSAWTQLFKPQQPSGIRIGKYFFMEVPQLGVNLKYEYEDETRKNNGRESTEKYHRFSERIGFRTKGFVYHPALFSYAATLEPEFSQIQEETSGGGKVSSNMFSPDYMLSATILKSKPYTFNLHANRKELPVWAPFKGGFESRVHDFGGSVSLDLKKLFQSSDNYHAFFSYRNTDYSSKGFYEQDTVSDDYYFNFTHQGPRMDTRLRTSYVDSQRRTEDVETITRTFKTDLFNTFLIRKDNRIALNSTWNYQFMDLDTVELQTFRINELLNARHRKNLTSRYEFNYNYSSTNSEDETNNFGLDASVQHFLFENLNTVAGAKGRYTLLSDGSETAVAPYLDLSYKRRVPGGNLSLGASWDYVLTFREYDDEQADRVIQNEKHILSFNQDSFLLHYNVKVETIIVTNPEGTIQYTEGIDYQLELIGNYISIRSLSAGDIGNGQPVLVHYVYGQDASFDDSLFTQHYTFSYNFLEHTTLSLSHSSSSQDILSGTDPRVSGNATINRASIQYAIDWSTTRLEGVDYSRPSDISYQGWQLTQRISLHPFRRLNFSFSGNYGEKYYQDEPVGGSSRGDSKFYGGGLKANWRIFRRLSFNIEGYTNIREDDLEKTVNTGCRAGLVYNYRIWSARLSYELSDMRIENDVQDSSRLRNFIRFDIIRLYW